MIVLYDSVQLHMSHAPFTRAFARIVAHACPGRRIVIRARGSHLRAAFAEPDKVLDGRLVQQPMEEGGPGPYIRYVLRFLRETCGGDDPPLVVFLSTQPMDVWAAKLFRRWQPRFRCHMVLHGDLGRIRQPRSRHPLHRLADLRGSMAFANHRDVRFLVLEPHIADALAAELPSVANVVDAIHHPCLPADTPWQDAPPPPRFGLVGIAGRAKGLDVFARLARQVTDGAEFRLVGKLQPGWEGLDLGGISGPLPFSTEWLPRDVFERELAALRYIVLPYDMGYYALSASGVLLDALRWRKPVIAFRTPVIDEFSQRFGDIGHVCDDEAQMLAVLRGGFDADRYAAQRQNLDAAYRSRLPEAVAGEYAALLRARWGGFADALGAMPAGGLVTP
jgi:hypothetical protein